MTSPAPSVPPQRLLSLDLLRGLTIAAMILVNNNGDARHAYWPLLHSRWNGWTPTDIVFPGFLFMVGMSMHLSFSARLRKGASRASIFAGTLRRACWLIVLGLVVNGFPFFDLHTLRLPGVLQRIALCSIAAAVLNLWSGKKGIVAAIVLLLAGYWILLVHVPVPGFGVPAARGLLLDPTNNLTSWIDRKLLPGHLYRSGIYDPEGLLSTLPAIASTLFGTLAARWVQSTSDVRRIVGGLTACGLSLILLGKIWSLWFPFNKRLWTSSYALLAAGIMMLLLAFCYWLVDVKKYRGRWMVVPEIFGTNAIFAYVFSELLASGLEAIRTAPGARNWKQTSAAWIVHTVPNLSLGSLLYSLLFVLVCLMATWLLYRRRIFLKL